jgi:quinoprotein glucose dehydrogenase
MKLRVQALQYLTSIALALACSTTLAWEHYGGDEGGSHYSALQQINRANVANLEQAWSFSSGEIEELPERRPMLGFNGTPILLPEAAGQSLVLCTALNRLVGLDPATGSERWRYDPEIELRDQGNKFLCRGIAYWQDSQADANAACKHRVFMATKDLRLIAVDGRSGELCESFGGSGQLQLGETLSDGIPNLNYGDLQMSAPPVVIGDTVITGFADNTKFWRIDSPRGQVLAFNARTGETAWSFNPVPTPADHTGPRLGGGNVWSMMSVDSQRGLVFMPTATAGPNNFGGYRPGNNEYANSVVAVDGESGEVIWHYQMVHHDVWDLDIPSQPILVDIENNGKRIPVVIQLTKMGLTFVLHRETGEPVFGVEERPVPTNGVAGELMSPTQPYPLAPPPLVEPGFTPDDAWGFFSFIEQGCREESPACLSTTGAAQVMTRKATCWWYR